MATCIGRTAGMLTLLLPVLALAATAFVSGADRPRPAAGQGAPPNLTGAVVTGSYSDLEERRVLGLDEQLRIVDLDIRLPDGFAAERVTLSPDGNKLAVTAVRVGGGEYLTAVYDGASTEVLLRAAGPNSRVQWNQDSDLLFFGHTPDGAAAPQIRSVDLQGRSAVVADLALPTARRSRCPGEGTLAAYAGDWLADGRLTLAALEQCPAIHEDITPEVLALDVTSGALELLADEASDPDVSDDGSAIAYVQAGAVVVRELTTGNASELADGVAPTFLEDGNVAFVQDSRPSQPGQDMVVEADSDGGGESEEVAGAQRLGDVAQVVQAPSAADELIALEAVDAAARLVLLRADGSSVPIVADVVDFDIASEGGPR